jgi:hypothetical protein
METTPTLEMLARFAAAIEADGIAAVPAELFVTIAATARTVGASAVAVGVLVDPTEPAVVRERAFRKLVIQIVGRAGRPAVPSDPVLLSA